jgi:hypothetical protein
MAERRHKRGSEDITELGAENSGILLEPAPIGLGSAYSLAVGHDENEKLVVDIKTYGQVNIMWLRREIKRIFPNAQIRQKGQQQVVTVAKKNKRRLGAAKKSSC